MFNKSKEIRRNRLVYFYAYFVNNLILIFINSLLPVYFFLVLNVNRTELAIIQLLAYSILFTKPIIAIYFDKERTTQKLFLIGSSIGALVSFIIFTLNVNILTIFGIFLSCNFLCLSVMTVIIDKMVVISSLDEKTRDRNNFSIAMGSMVGAIFPNLISFLIFTNMYSIPTWSLFFFLLSLAIMPMILISFFLKESIDMDVKEATKEEDIDKKTIVILCVLTFLMYSERLYQYPLEPWVLERYGEQYFSLLLLMLIILIILNVAGVTLSTILSSKYNRKKILFLTLALYGFLHIILPFSGLIMFFIILAIMQIIAGFAIMNLRNFLVKFSCEKVVIYQIFVVFYLLAVVVLTPLGTYLSSFISTELIIVIVGLLNLCGLIPVILLKYKKE